VCEWFFFALRSRFLRCGCDCVCVGVWMLKATSTNDYNICFEFLNNARSDCNDFFYVFETREFSHESVFCVPTPIAYSRWTAGAYRRWRDSAVRRRGLRAFGMLDPFFRSWIGTCRRRFGRLRITCPGRWVRKS
jgi:hypothetical protein